MPNPNPGIKPLIGNGRSFLFFLTWVFFPFWLHAQPVISLFAPRSGPIGATVTILGSNFNATPSANIVYFGATRATVSTASATMLTVKVPPMATYQPISVTTGGLTGYSKVPFTVTFNDPGQFTPEAFGTLSEQPTSGYPAVVCSKDLDGDGKTDLVVANSTQVNVFNNTGTVGFPNLTDLGPVLTIPSDNIMVVAVEDLDGDGKPDLVASLQMTPSLYIIRNISTPGHIAFDDGNPIIIDNTSAGIADIVIADLNGDGKPDIATLANWDLNVSVYTNIGTTGNIAFDTRQDLTLPPDTYPLRMIAADLDGDGMPELACSDYGMYSIDVFLNTGVRGGAISFATVSPIATGTPVIVDATTTNYPGTSGVAAGDLDGDGKLDLVATNKTFNTLAILKNNSTPGNLSFALDPTVLPTINAALNPAISDLDGDGRPDVVVSPEHGSSLYVHRNTSTPGWISLAAGVEYATGTSPQWVIATDLDGDGLPDLAAANVADNSISVMINKKADDLTVTGFSPVSGTLGTVVTITGTQFTGATDVKFGGTSASTFTVVSPTEITATVAGGSSGAVTVINPTAFAYKDGFSFSIPGPVITSFTPTTATAGDVVTIEGSAFNAVTSVSFGGKAARSFNLVSDTKIIAIVDAGASGDVTVTSATGNDASLAGFTFTTAPPPPPPPPVLTLTSFSPASGTQNTDITITGTNLTNISSVTFGGTPALSISMTSATSIHATVAGGSSGNVVVTGDAGTATLSGFTYIYTPPPPPPDPKLSSFSPQSGNNGTKIVIQGLHLSTVTAVTFGGVPALSYSIVSDNEIQAIVAVGATGQVKVTSPTASDSLAGFVFIKDTEVTSPLFQLVQFGGSVSNNQPHLTWQTRNDGGISWYAVERGVDGVNFNAIGTVVVSTKIGSSHTYSYTDASPRNGVNYYRLKMQDTASHVTYSSAIAFQLSGIVAPIVSVYPNPVKYGFFLADLPAGAGASEFLLADQYGRIIKRQAVAEKIPQVRIDVPGLPRGTYQLRWTDGVRTTYTTILIL